MLLLVLLVLFMCSPGLMAQATGGQPIAITVTPDVIRATSGKLPSSLPITVQPTSQKQCEDPDFDISKYSIAIAGNPGLTVSAKPLSQGKCTISYTVTVDPNVAPGSRNLSLVDSNNHIAGSTELSVADPNGGPIPPGLKPSVDVLWEVMSQKNCSDVFGARAAYLTYCIQLKIGNNSGYPIQIAGIAFCSSPKCDQESGDVALANSSYASTRAVLLMENVTNGRNIAYNVLNAIGVLMPAFAPFFGTGLHPNGMVNNARTHWGTWSSIIAGPAQQAFNIIAPNPVINQLNNLDDQAFRDNKVIPNNVQVQTVVFVEKQAVTNALLSLIRKQKYKEFDDALADYGRDTKNSTLEQTIKNSAANKRALFPSQGGFNPNFVKTALGNVVIVGRHIQYLDREQVVNVMQSVTAGSPTIKDIKPSNGIAGTEVQISGTNFGTAQNTSTVRFGSIPATEFTPPWTDTLIKVKVPDIAARKLGVVITTAAGDSAPFDFTILPAISGGADPPEGTVGTLVTLKGNFGDSGGKISFGGNATPITGNWDKNVLTFKVPDIVDPGIVQVIITSANGDQSSATNFKLEPKVTGTEPNVGIPSKDLALQGSFGGKSGKVLVSNPSIEAAVSKWLPDAITLTLPNNVALGSSVPVKVVSSDGKTESAPFNIKVAPVLASPDPLSVTQGQSFVIKGFFGASGNVSLKISGTAPQALSGTQWGFSEITVPIPAETLPGNHEVVIASIDGSQSVPQKIQVKPSSELSLSTGTKGSAVKITGGNFGDPKAQDSKVSFGTLDITDFSGSGKKWTNTEIDFLVPDNAPIGDSNVVVTVNGVPGAAMKYTVLQQ